MKKLAENYCKKSKYPIAFRYCDCQFTAGQLSRIKLGEKRLGKWNQRR
jgi:hypothetical protein